MQNLFNLVENKFTRKFRSILLHSLVDDNIVLMYRSMYKLEHDPYVNDQTDTETSVERTFFVCLHSPEREIIFLNYHIAKNKYSHGF